MEPSIEVVRDIARKTSREVEKFHYDAWHRSWRWPSVTKRESIFSQSVCGSECYYSYALCSVAFELGLLPIDVLFIFMSLQRKLGLMGGLPSKGPNEQWSSCGDSPWYWLQDGSAVATAETTRWDGWCDVVVVAWMELAGFAKEY